MNKHQIIIADFYSVAWQIRSKLANSRNEISRSNYDFSVSDLFTGGLNQAVLFRLFYFPC